MTNAFEKMTAPQVESRITETLARMTAAKARREELDQALAQALAGGEPINEIQREVVMVDAELSALPKALRLLQDAFNDRVSDDHRRASQDRMARAEASMGKLTAPAAKAAKALEELTQACRAVQAENPDLGMDAGVPYGTDWERYAAGIATGGPFYSTLLEAVKATPGAVVALMVASARSQANNRPRARTWSTEQNEQD